MMTRARSRRRGRPSTMPPSVASLLLLLLLQLVLLFPLLLVVVDVAEGLPEGFVREVVVRDRATTEALVAGAFAPNPRRDDHRPMLLVASKRGIVHVLENPDHLRDNENENENEIDDDEDPLETDDDNNDDNPNNNNSNSNNLVALDLQRDLCSNGDRGLLSIAVHPGFPETRWVYLYYTRRRDGVWGCLEDIELGPRNVLVRYTMNPATLLLEEETVLAEVGVLSTAYNNGGALGFGTDGALYLATGDGGVPESAPDRRGLHGKLLRLNDDGTVPGDNPYSALGVPCGKFGGTVPEIFREEEETNEKVDAVYCSEVYAWGFRNPSRMDAPLGSATRTTFSVVDTGGGGGLFFEEVNPAGTDYKERDYGWPDREGPCTTTTTTGRANRDCRPPPQGSSSDKIIVDPYHYYYRRSDAGSSAGAVALVLSDTWPDKYRRLLLNADQTTVHALLLNPDAECRLASCSPPTPGYTNTTFYEASEDSGDADDDYYVNDYDGDVETRNDSRMVDMFLGPYKDTQALYVLQNGSDGNSNSVLRFRYLGLPPVAILEVLAGGGVEEALGTAMTNETAGLSLPTSSTNAVDPSSSTSVPATATSIFLVGDAVRFDASGSFDPDGDEPLLFQWDFGDRTTGSSDSSYNATAPSHVYDAPGNYTVILVVSNARNRATMASTTVVVGTAPSVIMVSPREGDLYAAAGEPLRLEGKASDYRGNPIPDDRLVWEVRRYSPDGGYENLLEAGTAGNGLEVDPLAPPPSATWSPDTGFFLRVVLSVVDDLGLTSRVVTDVYPDSVAVELVTEPEGLTIAFGDDELVAPAQIETWVGDFPVRVTREQPPYRFRHWSDGITDADRTISMPSYRFRREDQQQQEQSEPEASNRITAGRPNRTVLTIEAIFCLIDNESCGGVLGTGCCSGFCDGDGFCRANPSSSSIGNSTNATTTTNTTNSFLLPPRETHTNLTVAKGEIGPGRKPDGGSNTTHPSIEDNEPDRKPDGGSNATHPSIEDNEPDRNSDGGSNATHPSIEDNEPDRKPDDDFNATHPFIEDNEPDRKPFVSNATQFMEEDTGSTESAGATNNQSQKVPNPDKNDGGDRFTKPLIGVSMAALLIALLYIGCKYFRLKVRLESESNGSLTTNDESRQRSMPPRSIDCTTPPRKEQQEELSSTVDETKRSFSSSNASFHSTISSIVVGGGMNNHTRFGGAGGGASSSTGDASSSSSFSSRKSASSTLPIWEKLASETERRAKLRAKLQSSPESTAPAVPSTPETAGESFPESPPTNNRNDDRAAAPAPSGRKSFESNPHRDGEDDDDDDDDDDSFVSSSALSPTSELTANINETLVRMDDLLSKISARKQARQNRKEALLRATSVAPVSEDDEEAAAGTAENDDGDNDDDDASDHSGHATHPAPIWLRESSAPGSPPRDQLLVTRSFSMSSLHTTSGSSAASNDGSTTSSKVKWLAELPDTSVQSLLVFQDNTTDQSISSRKNTTITTTSSLRDGDDDDDDDDIDKMESGLAGEGNDTAAADHSFIAPDDGEKLLRIVDDRSDDDDDDNDDRMESGLAGEANHNKAADHSFVAPHEGETVLRILGPATMT